MRTIVETILPFVTVFVFSVAIAVTDPGVAQALQGGRDWIAALSGWIAALAAFATILVMRRHHRELKRDQAVGRILQNLTNIRLSEDQCSAIAELLNEIDRLSDELEVKPTGRDFLMVAELIRSRANALLACLSKDWIVESEKAWGSLVAKSSLPTAEKEVSALLYLMQQILQETSVELHPNPGASIIGQAIKQSRHCTTLVRHYTTSLLDNLATAKPYLEENLRRLDPNDVAEIDRIRQKRSGAFVFHG